MFLIVGLGNPGREYENTRHNIGFRVIDRLSKDLGIDLSKSRCSAATGQLQWEGHKLILAKPETFMNLSGDSVAELVRWFKIEAGHLIVVHDDLDIEPGSLKVRQNGNSAGHHGVESIIKALGSPDLIRIRVGIGRGSLAGDNSQYVLSQVPDGEQEIIDSAVVSAAEAALSIVRDGVAAAMNRFNR